MTCLASNENGGLTTAQFWILTATSIAVILSVVANLTLVSGNRDRQVDVGTRAQHIQQAVTLENVYRDLLREVAELGVRNNDPLLRKLAESQGVIFNPPPAASELGKR
jgi:hypothetical protein